MDLNTKIHIQLAKVFLWLNLAAWFASTLVIGWVAFSGAMAGQALIDMTFKIQLIFLSIFVLGNLFLILGWYWWQEDPFKNA